MPKSKIKLNKLLKKQNPKQLSFSIMDILCKYFENLKFNNITNENDFIAAYIEIKKSLKIPNMQEIKGFHQNTLLMLSTKMSECCKEIVAFLNENKGGQEILLLEQNIHFVIQDIINEYNKLVTSLLLYGNIEQKTLAKVIAIGILETILFLDGNCQVINNNKLEAIDWRNDIENAYFELVNLCLDLEELDNTKSYLVKCKQAINELPDDVPGRKPCYWQGFYFVKSKLAIKENNFFAAKKYLLIAQSEMEKDIFPLPVSTQQLAFCKEIMLKNWLKGSYSEALFWAKALKFGHTKNFEIYSKWHREGNNLQFSTDNLGGMNEANEQIKHAKDYIHKIKSKIFTDKLALLNSFAITEIEFIANADATANKKDYSITIKVSNGAVTTLHKSLRLNKILCAYTEGAIRLTNLVYANVKKIELSLIEWQNNTERKEIEKKKIQNASLSQVIHSNEAYESEGVTETKSNTNIVIQPELKTNSAIKENKIKLNESKINNNNNTNIPEANKTGASFKTRLMIKWHEDFPVYDENNSNGEVYKIHGLALNHYCFIRSALLEDICENNPLAAQDLLNMCEYAKAIGNSQKAKGFIIKPNGIKEGKETFDAKLKNSSKDYRFFGHIISATKTEDGKTCQLLAIDSWQETHKSSVKTFK